MSRTPLCTLVALRWIRVLIILLLSLLLTDTLLPHSADPRSSDSTTEAETVIALDISESIETDDILPRA